MYLIDFAAKNAFAVANNKVSPFDWEKMEQLVTDGVSTADKDQRYQIYTELWKMVMDTKTILPVLHKGVGIAWSSNIKVPGLAPSYYHIDQWSWAE
jgi:ABC-type transport system substrate-binding protein